MKVPRPLIDQLVQALALPADFVGKVVVTVNIHRGEVGRITFNVEQAMTWADFCRQAHARPLLLQALDDGNLLQAERMYQINPRTRRRS